MVSMFLPLLFAASLAIADEPKPEAKKAEKAKPAAKAEKNSAQKAEASLTEWARKNKIWTTGEKKAAKKTD
jgi:hypothetical protein